MRHPTYNARLNAAETAKIHLKNKVVVAALSKSSLSKRTIDRRIQTDLKDVYERKSTACAYELARILHLIPPALQKALRKRKYLYLVTFGRPQDRVPVGKLKSFDPENLNRHFSRAIAKLEAMGVKNLKIFAVLEVQLVKPLDGAPYWEPHMHLIMSGATTEQIKEAYKIRKPAGDGCRKRPLHIKPISDLEGAIGYCLKFTPKVQVQYRTDAGLRWRPNRLPSEYLPEYYRFMSRFSPGQVLNFIGIYAGGLDKPLTNELSLILSETSRGPL